MIRRFKGTCSNYSNAGALDLVVETTVSEFEEISAWFGRQASNQDVEIDALHAARWKRLHRFLFPRLIPLAVQFRLSFHVCFHARKNLWGPYCETLLNESTLMPLPHVVRQDPNSKLFFDKFRKWCGESGLICVNLTDFEDMQCLPLYGERYVFIYGSFWGNDAMPAALFGAKEDAALYKMRFL
jgi:hypothetical protein